LEEEEEEEEIDYVESPSRSPSIIITGANNTPRDKLEVKKKS
tara:strand:- start:980 stop:1105 length:126 start_codon:yes stop_codon:yes gene_type:complete